MQTLGILMVGALAAGFGTAASAAPQSVTLKPVQHNKAVLDYAHAKPVPMPMARMAPSPMFSAVSQAARVQRPGVAGMKAGKPGSGEGTAVTLFTGKPLRQDAGTVEPQQSGRSGQPFTTSRANIESMKLKRGYPFTAVGRLFFDIGTDTYVCSASMIQPGVVVTAAHCVSSFGTNTYYTNFQYVPVYSNGVAPVGVWTAQYVAAPTKYLNGTTTCSPSGPGVVCEDDVAVMVLNTKGGKFAGEATGYLGYGWDGAGFTSDNLALITQLGYPVASDGGEIMQRTDSQGFVDPDSAGNTVIGSEMQGGSSGGPWVADWGIAATGSLGKQPPHNVVVGVTSWGYVDPRIKQQGAAPFLSTNIVPLVSAACAAVPAACAN